MNTKQLTVFFILCILAFPLLSQDLPPIMLENDSIPTGIAIDTLVSDSMIIDPSTPEVRVLEDSLGTDSIVINSSTLGIKLSKDSLDAQIEYSSKDTMVYDFKNNKVYLYGNANVAYNEINLTANYIEFDWSNNVVTATAYPDSSGRMSGFPHFKDGTQEFDAKKMRYNFKDKKGVVFDVTTEQQDIIIHGRQSKFVTEQLTDSTSRDVIYSRSAIFTSCTADEPHFGIRSSKQKIVPGKQVIIGPSNLEIMGVPTPLWLPFGFFPITETRKSGLLIPSDYGYKKNLGYGLNGLGWFFPLGEHFNLTLRSELYWNGTWGITANSQYNKRYKYTGNFTLGYRDLIGVTNDTARTSQKTYTINWSHNQAAKAHPTVKMGGSVNIRFGKKNTTLDDDPNTVLNNTLSSNFKLSKSFRDLPISFDVSLRHSQNDLSHTMNVTLPQVNFRTQTLYPLRRKIQTGGSRWYEDITFQYTMESKHVLSGTDTSFFQQQTLDDAQFGIKQNASTGTSIKFLKYFNISPSASLQEVWYMKSLDKVFIDEPEIDIDTLDNGIIVMDTTSYGSIEEYYVNGLKAYRSMNTSVNLNTQVFSTLRFKKGPVKGIRYVAKPNLSFNYSPDYKREELDYFRYLPSTTSATDSIRYSPYEDGIYGAPLFTGKQMALRFSMTNIFEAKYFSKRDSADKKMKLFNTLRVGGGYNFAADSLKWDKVTLSGTTSLFNKMTTLRIGASWDPYYNEWNESGTSTTRRAITYFDAKGKIVQFQGASARLSSSINIAKIKGLFTGKEDAGGSPGGNAPGGGQRSMNSRSLQNYGSFIDLFSSFSISHNINFAWERTAENKDTVRISIHSLDVRGSLSLTDNWKINVGSIGYDFIQKSITYPSIGFSRDLHCWAMSINWRPTNNAFTFSIYAKSGPFSFLKVPYQRSGIEGGDPFR